MDALIEIVLAICMFMAALRRCLVAASSLCD